MVRALSSRPDEAKVTLRLLEALGSSLDIRVVLKEAYPLLTLLAPADYGALGVSPSARPEEFEWTVAELPAAFFAAYPDMAAHDFVRKSVATRPNVVLRDQDMVSRRELEKNMMYRRAREVGAPIEQVMAVMLHVDDRWQSGFSLYRERRRPFSASERARLQRVTPALTNAVRNCHLFGLAADWKLALERLLQSSAAAILLASDDATEVTRSQGATQFLERWFERNECRGKRLPEALAAVLKAAAITGTPAVWRQGDRDLTLQVSFLPLTGHFGDARWMLRFEEHSDALAVPEHWRLRLTKREQQVTSGVLQGWDNRQIGAELVCAEATVKRHLLSIFEKLGVESRTVLVVRAAQKARD
jgi:DNA-binding NarL/FixJ family response regulator